MAVPHSLSRLRNLDGPRVRHVFKQLIREFADDRVGGLAAEVAFFGILSVFPGLLMLAAALGSLDVFVSGEVAAQAQDLVIDFLTRVLTDDASNAVGAVENLFVQDRGGVITVSLLIAAFSLTRGFSAVIVALDLAYDLDERRTWWRQRLTALFLGVGTIIMAAIVLTMLVAGPLFGEGRSVAQAIGAGRPFAIFWDWFRWPFAGLLLIAWATTMYHLGPNQRKSWFQEVPGAVLAAVLWIAVSLGFNLYLRLAAGLNQVLGALGGALILLVWFYLLSASLLVGGELNAILARAPLAD